MASIASAIIGVARVKAIGHRSIVIETRPCPCLFKPRIPHRTKEGGHLHTHFSASQRLLRGAGSWFRVRGHCAITLCIRNVFVVAFDQGNV
jgi:hypothetical protein